MQCGKIASQAGHAYLGAFVNSNLQLQSEYHSDFPNSPGTKICLKVDTLDQLLHIEKLAIDAGFSTFKVIDSGCKNFFGGNPIVTALGIGPVTKSQIQSITKHLKLL